jgi:hypothetical protein
MNRLFWLAVLAFLVLPATVAFAVPLLLIAPAEPGSFTDALGLIPLALGNRSVAVVRAGFIRGGQGHTRTMGASAGTGHDRLLPLLNATRCTSQSSWCCGAGRWDFAHGHWRSMLSG